MRRKSRTKICRMAFQSGAVFSEVTLFPKKRHSFGSTHFVFFPRRRFETQETVPTGIVARPPRSRSSRSLDLRKSRNVPRRCFRHAHSVSAAGGVEKDRPNLSFASRSVGGLDASARSSPTGTTGSRRVASSIRARSREHVTCLAVFRTRHEHHVCGVFS